MRTYGDLLLVEGTWHLRAEPHVITRAKRVFPRAYPGAQGQLMLRDTPEMCTDLAWLMGRWRMRMSLPDIEHLDRSRIAHEESRTAVERILAGQGARLELMKPAREARQYQLDEVAIMLATGSNLVIHAAGLGKTATALYPLGDPRCRPGLFVTLTHLPEQVVEQLELTYPELHAHILKNGDIYDPTVKDGRDVDLIVTSYSKLSKWSPYLREVVRYVNFDEIQELRHAGSMKYIAAQAIRANAAFAMGTTATPVYGYGGEMWNIVEITQPGFLGSHSEFVREWAGVSVGAGSNVRLNEAGALGAHLRAEGIMSVKTRKDVGRELVEPVIMTEPVICEAAIIEQAERNVNQIARDYLAGGQAGIDRMQMASQLDMVMRQATGVGKARSVADFVKLLMESEERIVLFGWHRQVYDIWLRELREFQPVLYTGSESPKQKADSKARFIKTGYPDSSRILIMSLRAGAGIDGLQEVCSCVVFGELDWSPQVHRQNIWRVDRDGQQEPVAAYFCVSDGGTDPLMEETLELKSQQSGAIIEADADTVLFNVTPTDEGRMARLAQTIVSRHA